MMTDNELRGYWETLVTKVDFGADPNPTLEKILCIGIYSLVEALDGIAFQLEKIANPVVKVDA